MKKLSRHIYTPTNLNQNLLRRLRANDSALVRIIFSSRNLGSQGVRILMESLQMNTKLNALDLSSNSIGPQGASAIALFLHHQMMISRSNSMEEGGIKTLILGDNSLCDEGVKALAYVLENSLLESLWIDNNFIGARGLATLSDALQKNSRMRRLHLHSNSFQSVTPLIKCTFNKQSLNSVADSNHILTHIFLNCGYSYECEELEMILKMNRMGKMEARRKKIALFLEEDMGRLLQIDMDSKLLPMLLGILTNHCGVSTVFRLLQNLPSVVQGTKKENISHINDPMDIEYLS